MESVVLDLAFAPRLDWGWIAALGGAVVLAAGAGFRHRRRGSPGRLAAAGALLVALANPQLEIEQRERLADVVLLAIDASGSQTLGMRPHQTRGAEAELVEALDAMAAEGDFTYRRVPVENTAGAGETRLLSALEAAAREIDAGRIAGAVLVTDGQVHDAGVLEEFPGPVHALVTGEAGERDRRIRLLQAPTFGILRDGVEVSVRVEDAGAGESGPIELEMRVDDRLVDRVAVVPGAEQRMQVPLGHAGRNVVELRVPEIAGEITGRNNRSVFAVNGIRDRLRVLLVSGSPHPAARMWRNLLKSDPAVDLIHFVLLRPVNKQRIALDTELSLIQFPAQRLFVEEIDSFDLIIFDRFRRQGILPDTYFANFARYVREGGAVLLAGSASYASSSSIARSAMREVLPADPTGRLLATRFDPELSGSGARHPLTSALAEALAQAGPWYQQAGLDVQRGQVLLTGIAGLPLLVVDRVGEGRVGVLASEHAWLWSRDHGGGGPHGELIRRTAHWLMKEPELEEEALRLEVADETLTVTRRTLADVPQAPVVAGPDGTVREVPLAAIGPGLWQGTMVAAGPGVYRAEAGGLAALALAGSADSVEFRDPVSTTELLAPLAGASGGSIRRLTEGVPQVRRVAAESAASGGDWIGFPRREAYAVLGLRHQPLIPAWLALLLVIGGLGLAWWMESGRRSLRAAVGAPNT